MWPACLQARSASQGDHRGEPGRVLREIAAYPVLVQRPLPRPDGARAFVDQAQCRGRVLQGQGAAEPPVRIEIGRPSIARPVWPNAAAPVRNAWPKNRYDALGEVVLAVVAVDRSPSVRHPSAERREWREVRAELQIATRDNRVPGEWHVDPGLHVSPQLRVCRVDAVESTVQVDDHEMARPPSCVPGRGCAAARPDPGGQRSGSDAEPEQVPATPLRVSHRRDTVHGSHAVSQRTPSPHIHIRTSAAHGCTRACSSLDGSRSRA